MARFRMADCFSLCLILGAALGPYTGSGDQRPWLGAQRPLPMAWPRRRHRAAMHGMWHGKNNMSIINDL